MKCKECRERIPDNVKYCPECGALVNENGGSFRSSMQADYSDADNSRKPAPRVQFGGFSVRKEKRPRISVFAVFLLILIFCFVTGIFSTVFNMVTDWGTPVEVYVEEDSVMAEDVAYQYALNVVDSQGFQSVELFRSQTLIEWELVCRDFYTGQHHDETACHEAAENCMHNVFDLINSRYSIGFEPFNFYIDCQGTRLLDNIESEYYFSQISSSLNSLGADAEDYYDRDQIGNLYEVQYYVSTTDENSYVWDDFGTINVIVAEVYGQHFVLYDDVYISTLLDSVF